MGIAGAPPVEVAGALGGAGGATGILPARASMGWLVGRNGGENVQRNNNVPILIILIISKFDGEKNVRIIRIYSICYFLQRVIKI